MHKEDNHANREESHHHINHHGHREGEHGVHFDNIMVKNKVFESGAMERNISDSKTKTITISKE